MRQVLQLVRITFPIELTCQTFLSWYYVGRQKQTQEKIGIYFFEQCSKITLHKLSDWVQSWAQISDFCLTKQTFKAFVVTLRAQTMLMQELLGRGYEYIFTRRLQRDALENRFSLYRQMRGGTLFVIFCEVLNRERILTCQSLLKENINFWKEGLKTVQKNSNSILLDILAHNESEMHELSLSLDSKEVAYTISGYITKKTKTIKRFQCEMCSLVMVDDDSDDAREKQYFDLLSREGLTNPFSQRAVCLCLFCYTWLCRYIYYKT